MAAELLLVLFLQAEEDLHRVGTPFERLMGVLLGHVDDHFGGVSTCSVRWRAGIERLCGCTLEDVGGEILGKRKYRYCQYRGLGEYVP
jgi:hypothetical protein